MDQWNNGTRQETNLFLGTVEQQNLTKATVGNLIVYGTFFFEGILMVLGNTLLISVILTHKPLRRKEMYIIAGLAMGDILYGTGFFFSGIRRFSLALAGKHLWKVTPWSCMKAVQNPFFIAGSQAAAFMLVMVSVDRLLAIWFYAFYLGLGNSYAKTIILVVFGYCIATVPITVLLSAYAANPNPSVPVICISTHVGPGWFSSYQPTIQMTCGILSVVIYILSWVFYQNHFHSMSHAIQNHQMEHQRKLTRTVGKVGTFFCLFRHQGLF